MRLRTEYTLSYATEERTLAIIKANLVLECSYLSMFVGRPLLISPTQGPVVRLLSIIFNHAAAAAAAAAAAVASFTSS